MRSKVLVVDDTPLNVKLLADLLAVKGYDVVTASMKPSRPSRNPTRST